MSSALRLAYFEPTKSLRTLGTSFSILKQSANQRCLSDVLRSMCKTTVALDHYHDRGGVADLRDIIAARNTIQHQLLSLPTELEHGIYDLCRFAALIFSDMVLFPLPPATAVKPRLAVQLRRALGPFSVESWRNEHLHILLWAVVMGGIASWDTRNRLWYAFRLHDLSARLGLVTWESCKYILSTCLWWEHVCSPAAIVFWNESRMSRGESVNVQDIIV